MPFIVLFSHACAAAPSMPTSMSTASKFCLTIARQRVPSSKREVTYTAAGKSLTHF